MVAKRKRKRPRARAAARQRRPRLRLRTSVLVALIAVLAVGGLLRAAYLAEIRHSPDFTVPFSDAGYHDYWARGMAFHTWTPPANERDPGIRTTPYLRPPGYPFLLSFIYRLFGTSYLTPRIAQMVLGLVSALLAFLAGRRWYGDAVGLVAAGLMSIYWIFIYFEGELHAPALLIPLLLWFLYATGRWAERPSIGRGAVAGVVVGLAALVRPNALILIPAVGLWAWWLVRRGAKPRPLGVGFVALLLGAAVAVLPATVRNYVVSGDFIPITSNTGINLYIGNNERADGLCTAELPGIAKFASCYDYPGVVSAIEKKVGRPLSHGEVSAFFTREATRFVRTHPGRALGLAWRKALLFWGPREITHNKVVEMERDASAVLRRIPLNFPLVLALAVVGLLLAVKRSREPASGDMERSRCTFTALVALFAVAWFVSILPFFVSARYRVPVIPFLVLLAAFGAVSLVELARSRRYKRLWVWLSVGVGIFALGSVNFAGYEPNRAKWHYNRAMSYAAIGDVELAIAGYEDALRENPDHWQSHLDLGVALVTTGRVDESVAHFREALRLNPGNPYVQYNVGLLCEVLGDLEGSERHLSEVLRMSPEFPGVREDLARVRRALADEGD